MPKYVVFYSFKDETVARFVEKPSDRAAVVRKLAVSLGGKLESYYWMFGDWDGLAIFDLPDAQTMAALSLALTGSGAFSRVQTHELIAPGDLRGIAARAKEISYSPPGG